MLTKIKWGALLFLSGALALGLNVVCAAVAGPQTSETPAAVAGNNGPYEPTWESLDKRPVAQWYTDAKFGIYIHWTLAAVPAWGLHTTFYWPNLLESREKEAGGKQASGNSIEEEYAGLWQFHVKNYGADFTFDEFAPMFRAELFDADRWADVIARSGAKYVVLVAKHHDGFALWPDPYSSKAYGRPWNSVETGPKRDIVQELSTAVRKRDMKMGLYYSFFEWFNPLWLTDKPRYVTEHMQPQLRNMITNYKPDLLWADGEWDGPDTFWKSREFLTWLFNESADRDVVVNDRWGDNSRHRHGGFYTTEFAAGMKDEPHAWEENRTTVRPLKYDADGRPLFYQWVVSRSLILRDYYTPWELIVTLVDTVSRGGNLVLNVGPTADGRILAIQEERLAQIGDWLKVNGEAIYGTRPWRTNCQWSPGERPKIDYNQEWRVRYEVGDFARRPEPGKASVQAFFTSKGNTLYAIVPRWPAGKLTLQDVYVPKGEKVTMLGVDGPLAWKPVNGGLEIAVPPLSVDDLPCRYAYVIKVPGGAR